MQKVFIRKVTSIQKSKNLGCPDFSPIAEKLIKVHRKNDS